MASSCEQAMLNAGYKQTEFKMHGEDTIEILSNEIPGSVQAYLRHSLDVPNCNIVCMSPHGLVVLASNSNYSVNITAKSIKTWSLHNHSNIKAEKITVALDNFIMEPLQTGPINPVPIPKIKKKYNIMCGLTNSEKATIEALEITADCNLTNYTVFSNNGLVTATTIRVNAHENNNAISNGDNDGEGTIIADKIDASGRWHGIFNSKKATIQAKHVIATANNTKNKEIYVTGLSNDGVIKADSIEGIGRDAGISNWGKIISESIIGTSQASEGGRGIRNLGTIQAQTAKCCGTSNYDCYVNTLSGKKGEISTEVENICKKSDDQELLEWEEEDITENNHHFIKLTKDQPTGAKIKVIREVTDEWVGPSSTEEDMTAKKYRLIRLTRDQPTGAKIKVVREVADHIVGDEWVGPPSKETAQ